MRVLADARRSPAFVLAAALWGGVVWTEPRFGAYSLVGALARGSRYAERLPRWGTPLFLGFRGARRALFRRWLSLPDVEPGLLAVSTRRAPWSFSARLMIRRAVEELAELRGGPLPLNREGDGT